VQNDFDLAVAVELPDKTRLYGKKVNPGDPLVKLTATFNLDSFYTIKMGSDSALLNLNIDNTQPNTPLSTIIVLALGNNNIIANNEISGSASIGVMLGYVGVYANYNAVLGNLITADGGVGIAVSGFNNIINKNNINGIAGTLVGKTGILLIEWPQLSVSNNTLRAAPGGFALQFAKNIYGAPMPIGMAANLLTNNSFPIQFTNPNDPNSVLKTSNFEVFYGMSVGDLPTCDGKTASPYYDDGTCKSAAVANANSSCPASQIKLADGSCGCVDGTSLDPDLKVCVKTIEKTVEKIVEVPATNLGKDGATPKAEPNPFGAPPTAAASDGGNCTLMTNIEHPATPITAFLMIITISGLVAFRSQRKVQYEKSHYKKSHL